MLFIGLCAVCAALFSTLLKKGNGEYALLASIGACTVLFLVVLEELGPLLSQIQDIADGQELPAEIFTALLKAVGIALIGELSSRICKDAGESALAFVVDAAMKTAILAVSLPLIGVLLRYLEEIIAL